MKLNLVHFNFFRMLVNPLSTWRELFLAPYRKSDGIFLDGKIVSIISIMLETGAH